MTSSAEKMTDVFTRAFDLFGSCHRGYNSSHCMAEKDIDDLGNIPKYSRTHHIYLFFLMAFVRIAYQPVPEVLQGSVSFGYHFAQNAHTGGSRYSLDSQVEIGIRIDGRTGRRIHSCPCHEVREGASGDSK